MLWLFVTAIYDMRLIHRVGLATPVTYSAFDYTQQRILMPVLLPDSEARIARHFLTEPQSQRRTDNACLFYMANEKTRRSSKSADHKQNKKLQLSFMQADSLECAKITKFSENTPLSHLTICESQGESCPPCSDLP